jgi:hypothetical protein
MFSGGLLGLLSGVFGGVAGAGIGLGCFLVGSIVPAVYSFVIARREGA